jgi:hypothetical protein
MFGGARFFYRVIAAAWRQALPTADYRLPATGYGLPTTLVIK